MKIKSSEFKVYDKLESSAIKSIKIKDKTCVLVFNNSDKEYFYDITNENFVELLDNTITNKESVGKYVTKAIRENILSQINTIVD